MFTFLGKKDRSGDWSLPLMYHLYDVATSGDFLWDRWLSTAIKADIESVLPKAKSIFLLTCYLHDIGKFSNDFQSHINSLINSKDLLDHVTLASPLLRKYLFYSNGIDKITGLERRTKFSYNGICDTIDNFAIYSLVRELISYHHGIPSDNSIDTTQISHFSCLNEVFKYIDDILFKLDLDKSVFFIRRDSIPFYIRDILSGLLIMSDWIGSNTSIFPLYKDFVPSYESRKHKAIRVLDTIFPSFHSSALPMFSDNGEPSVFGFQPNLLQKTVLSSDLIDVSKKRLVFIEAPTGLGKTEAALSLAHRYISDSISPTRGIYIAMPTRATSNALYDRVNDFLNKAFYTSDSDTSRTYLKLYHSKSNIYLSDKLKNNKDIVASFLGDEKVCSVSECCSAPSIFCGKLSQAAPFVLGTTDHILQMCLNSKHFTMQHLCLTNKVIIFDEVHCYDDNMFACLIGAISILSMFNVPIIILSATLPISKRKELIDAYGADKSICINSYPRGKDICYDSNVIHVPCDDRIDKNVYFDLSLQTEYQPSDKALKDANAIIDKINELGREGYYGVIVNTVKRAQDMYTIFCNSFGRENAILLHSRLESSHRNDVESEIINLLGKKGLETRKSTHFKVIISTQIIEQSIDIDFDCIFSDLCPMDLLLQRVGRLHRHSQNDVYRPSRLRGPTCFVMQAYTHVTEETEQDIKSFLKSAAVKDELFYSVDSYAILIYPPFLLYSTYVELLNYKDRCMNTVTETESAVNKVYDLYNAENLFIVNVEGQKVSLFESCKLMCDKSYNVRDGIFSSMLKKYKSSDEFKCDLNKGHLLNGGFENEPENVYVRNIMDSLEVIVLRNTSDGYMSCYNSECVDIDDRLSLERHTLTLPSRIVRKCGGSKNLKEWLNSCLSISCKDVSIPFIIFPPCGETFLLEDKVKLRYDPFIGLCDDYEISD